MQVIKLSLEGILKKITPEIKLPEEYVFFSNYIKRRYIEKEIHLIFFKEIISSKSISREDMNKNIYNFFLDNNIKNFEENMFLLFRSLKDDIIIKKSINNIILDYLQNIIG